jgi:UDP-N-acetyl-2-amino-2-deoxyglucuronate dehydrogenase
MARHGIGIIGLGMAVTPHAKSLIDLKDRLVGVKAFSPSEKRRQAFAAKFPFPTCESYEAILSDPAIDIVLILTPPNTHLELVRQAAAAGKHVLLEKPVDITTARASELVETCERAGVTLGIVLQHRFRRTGMKLRQMLAAGELGRMVTCSAHILLWRPQAYYDEPGRGTRARDGGGVLMSQAIHTLDLMLSLSGPVREVTGFATTSGVHRMETEDVVCAALTYENGALGTIEATTTAFAGFPERIEIIGETASAMIAGTEMKVFHHDGRVTVVEPDQFAGGTGADPMAFPHDYHLGVITDFLDAVDDNRAPAISGREALKVHRLIDALLEASASGRVVRMAP